MKDLIELTKDYDKENDITLYTIALEDGQELVITENEFLQLKEKINKEKTTREMLETTEEALQFLLNTNDTDNKKDNKVLKQALEIVKDELKNAIGL